MNLKQRFAIYFSILFSTILGIVLIVIFSLFSDYRNDQFRMRLEQKVFSTVKLLVNAKLPPRQMMRILDQNPIDKLYNEKLLVFNHEGVLVYSNMGYAPVDWSQKDIEYLKSHKSFYRHQDKIDFYGYFHDSRNREKDFFVLISAEDKYAHRQMAYLGYVLLGAFIFGTLSVMGLSYYVSVRSFSTLDKFKDRIAEISGKKMDVRLEDSGKNDEVNALAKSFNQMMDRIDVAYKQQKEFTDNASHELRTPVARVLMQLHNLLLQEQHSPNTVKYLHSIQEDATQMADIISSLLLLSRIDKKRASGFLPPCRIDEAIFEAMQVTQKTFADYRIQFDIDSDETIDADFEIRGDMNLLKIVFTNLLKNAYLYSADKQVNILLKQEPENIKVIVTNNGKTLSETEQQNLYKAFARGSNARKTDGTGLGLRIVERILHHHDARISYDVPQDGLNRFTLTFKV
ncbi:MAG: HAMP domain-containing sensor histidine kinase [Bacteroidota bacterium]|nr:HAMP domain-containing sensor histidine kinase [Bacteroidota bacterium]